MVSRRKRSNSSVGNKLNNLTDKVTEQQKLQQVSGTQTNAVTNDSIALGAVNTESVVDRSITGNKIGRGEVTSENLGVINEIIASDGLDIENGVDGHFSLSGGKYEEPYDGIEDGLDYKVVAFDPATNAVKIIDASPPAESGLRFDTTYTEGSTAVGMLSWTDEFETLEFLADDNVSIQIGQETVYRVKNASGSVAIPKFRLVMFAGATGDTVTVSPATATAIAENPAYLVGITAEEIPADGFGFVTHFGFVTNVNTNSYTLGNLLYLDPATTTGTFTTTKPSAPFFDTPIAAVTRVQTNSGRVLVRMAFGSKMDDLHDAQITSASEGQTLLYTSGGYWANTNTPSQNYIINGGFDIWQRGTSTTTNDVYLADRWIGSRLGGTHTISRSTDVPTNVGAQYSLSFASTSGTIPQILQRIESIDSVQFAGQTVTLSVWAKSTVGTGGLSWAVGYPGGVDDWVASSTQHASGTFTATMTLNSWTRYSATFTADSLATRGYYVTVYRSVSATSTTTLYAGVQLELGSVATPFRRHLQSVARELDACQRYYVRFTPDPVNGTDTLGTGAYNTTTNANIDIVHPVVMRRTPTSIETSGTAAHFFVVSSSPGAATSVPVYADEFSSPYRTRVSLSTGSVNDGDGAILRFSSTSGYFGINAEL